MVMEIKYSEPNYPLITYHLAVDERKGVPVVAKNGCGGNEAVMANRFVSSTTKKVWEEL